MYSSPIKNLISAFTKLPSVGERTAERFVFYLLKSGKKEVAELTLALKQLFIEVTSCKNCWDFADTTPCAICADKKRDNNIICVVAEPQDLQVLEKTNAFNGVYHVLRGVIKSSENNLGELKIKELLERAKNKDLREIILALNPNLEGETTAMALEKLIKEKNPQIKISRLARGLPMGGDLQYADEITLSNALKHRN
ncbi:MAG: Recombination protein RecR [Candidatus Magasanikbacteria bacterium GW2011_GWC2_37_14]|uniref:Recombination protein RecR n=1 Tax=Candidatus Magasanikbacteria bacterium GW2011_GWC2_37_14 TaxID=1619046 RepID=A0A0G0G871_9BACT|nr:MAG: Recombination protein RecR [Candidatus Magasanikbacteria bacterium GW2011_GWC2_37_14]